MRALARLRVVIKVKEEGDKIAKVVEGKEVVLTVPVQRTGSKKHVIVRGLNNYRFEGDDENYVS